MEEEFVEAAVRELYGRAKLDWGEPCGAPRLAAALLGNSCIQRVPRAAVREGLAIMGYGEAGWIINVPRGLSARCVNHLVAHELAEWFLERVNYVQPDREDVAKKLAAAICVPEPALHRAAAHFGPRPTAISRHFLVSQSLLLLRAAECSGTSTALITPRRRLVRGEPWSWPGSDEEWLVFLEEIQTRCPEAFCVLQVTDAPGRLVLRAGARAREPCSARYPY